jgi:hypothetical protein
MRHYRFENWMDLARGVVPEETREAMQRHLRHGCQQCSAEYALWSAMSEFASAETVLNPPSEVVRTVKLALPDGARTPVTARIKEIAQLLFDSFQTPQIEGVRAAHLGGRQLLYKAGPILIDMRLELSDDSGRCSLTGQVFRSEKEPEAMRDLGVHLLRGQSELANTQTNSLGEFAIEYKAEKDLQVAVEVSPVKDVYLPLEGTFWRPTRNS